MSNPTQQELYDSAVRKQKQGKPLTAAEIAAFQTQATIDALGAKGYNLSGLAVGSNVATTSTSKSLTKLSYAAAKTLLTEAASKAQYPGQLSSQDIKDFMAKFDIEQAKQIATIIKKSRDIVKPGASQDAITNAVNNAITTESPSFLKPADFASDYVWSKVNFSKKETLGGNSLTALSSVRNVLRGFGTVDFSEAEVQAAAKRIAKGEISVDDFRSTISAKVGSNYPQYAERLASTPGSTLRDLVSPYINLMAKELELDPETIKLDDPLIDRAIRPDGTAGKMPTMSLADFRTSLRNSPAWEKTTTAKESARDAATSMARAFGFGV